MPEDLSGLGIPIKRASTLPTRGKQAESKGTPERRKTLPRKIIVDDQKSTWDQLTKLSNEKMMAKSRSFSSQDHTSTSSYKDASLTLSSNNSRLLSDVESYLRERNVTPALMRFSQQFQKSQQNSLVSVGNSSSNENSMLKLERLSVLSPAAPRSRRVSMSETYDTQSDNDSTEKPLVHHRFDSTVRNSLSVRRKTLDNKSAISPLLLAALEMNTLLQQKEGLGILRFRKVAKSVYIMLQWFKWLSRNLRFPLEWSWSYDPDTYLDDNPFLIKQEMTFQLGKNFMQYGKYSGWLHEGIRNLLRKEPVERTPDDISILLRYFASMKAFQKYDENSRRLFLTNGRYNRWGLNRHVIKEGQPANSFYILLEGEVDIWKFDKEGAALAKAKNKQLSNIKVKGEEVRRNLVAETQFEDAYKITIGKFRSGDSFGEVAFTQVKDKKRAATVTTSEICEFLVIDNSDAKSILKVQTDQSLAIKLDFIDKLPLLKSLRIDGKTLSFYCTLKNVAVDTCLMTEGENSDYMYFIR
jgi:CRP-like cAMP-binding protein